MVPTGNVPPLKDALVAAGGVLAVPVPVADQSPYSLAPLLLR